jgi:hypothetical protein
LKLQNKKVGDYEEFKEYGQRYSNPFVALAGLGQASPAQQRLAITADGGAAADAPGVDRRESGDLEDEDLVQDFVVMAVEPDAREDYLGLVRELLGMSDKSNIESVHECQRLEGQEPIGAHTHTHHRMHTTAHAPLHTHTHHRTRTRTTAHA